MEKIILNKSKFEEKDNNGAFVFPLLSEAHSPYLISLEDDVDLKGKTLYFVPGDVLRANGGTLKNGRRRAEGKRRHVEKRDLERHFAYRRYFTTTVSIG